MSATSGGGSVSDGSEAGESSQSTMSVSDSPSTSFQAKHSDNVTKITLSEDGPGFDLTGSKINLTYDDRQQSDGVVNMAFDYEEGMGRGSGGGMSMSMSSEAGGRAGAGMSSGMSGGAAGGGMSGGMSAGSAGGMGGGSAGGMSAGSAGGIGGGSAGGMGGGSAGGMGGGSAGGMSGTGGGISGSMAGGIAGGISGGIAGGTAAGMAGGMSGGVAGGQGSGMSGGMGSGGASAGGAEKKDKVPEAVNLELVNMVPYSNGNGTSYGVPVNGIPGIPVKKDSEQADMSTPYDEYFVPVNEHKKYMRGEKLYVTKDKRRPTSWRRCLSWIVACTVISVVLIVAILAGTGVILSDDQNGVKEASVGRNFAGASFRPGVTSKQTNGSNMYVPRSIESELIVDNLDLDPALLDSNSSAYQQFAKNMEEKLKMILFDKEILESAASDIGLRVVNVSRDPFKVNYRIGWNYKEGSNNSVEPIKMEEVKQKLIESLSRNQGYIDKYHIDGENIKVDHVVNECQMNNGGCSHICYYNYITQLFTCTCPTHLVLDDSRKNCVEWTGSSEQDFLLVPDRNSHPSVDMNFQQNVHYDLGNEKDGSSQFQPGGEDEAHELMHHGGHHQHDHNHEYHHDVNNQRPGGEPEAEPTPEPAPEPAPEPGTNSEDSDSSSKSKSDNKNWSHSGVYVHGDSGEDEPVAEPSPEPTSDTDSEDGHHSKDHEPSAEPSPEPNSDSFDHSSKYGQNGATEHSSKDQSETELESSRGHESNSQSGMHHGMDHGGDHDMDHHFMVPGTGFTSTGDHEPSAEPTPEPGSDNKDNSHDSHTGFGYINSREHGESQEPSAEPTPEPGSDTKDDSHTHDSHTGFGSISSGDHEGSHEPSAEPTPEPGSDTKDDSHTHDSHTGIGSINSGEHEGSHEPSAEPTPGPDSDTKDNTHESHTGFGSINSGEHGESQEPSAEPSPDTKDNTHDSHTGFGSINSGEREGSHEPSAEPTPGPDSDTKDNTHDSHTGFGSINSGEHEGSQEPSAEPTPEPSPDTKDNTHDSHTGVGYTDSEHGKSQEPSAEPTPEPGTDSSDHEKSHPGVYNHQESIDSSTEQNSNSRKPGDSSSTMQIHGGTDGLTSDPNQSTNSNDNVHTSLATDNEHEKAEEPVAEPTPEPGSADQDHHQQMNSNADREPSDDHKRIQETDPETISHLFTVGGSRSNDESQNEEPNSTGSSIMVGREGVEGSVGSTQKPGVDSTSGHETTTPHIETQPGHEGQITEGRQHDPMTHSQPGVSVIQTQNTNSETTTDTNSNVSEKESQTVGFVGEKDKEQPVDGVHSMTHFNMKPEEVEGKTATESIVEFKHPEQTSESQMGVQTQTSSGQTPENEKQGPGTGVNVNNERGGSNTESTPEHATEPKEHETLNKSEQKPDDQSDKVVTDSFHKYILGQDGSLKPESKEGEVAPKGSGDESTMTTARPDISAGRETDSSQTPTTLSPHISMGSGPVGVTGSVLEQILLNDSISHPVHGVHERTDAQSKTNTEPTDHHVPSFQDILIKESSPSTIFNHPEGQNVSDSEAKNDNTPVIETVIFDKSSPQSSDSHGTMSDNDGKSEAGKSETGETENVTSNPNNAETDKNIKESSTAHPGVVLASAKDSLSGVTINPTVVEYVASSDSQNNGEKKEDEMKTTEGAKGLGVTEPSNVESKGYEVTELTSDTEPPTEHPKLHFGFAGTTQQPNLSVSGKDEESSSVSESDSKKPTDELEKSKVGSVSGDETAKTTLRPEYNRERATIPVTIIAGDFPSPYDGSSRNSEIFQRNPIRGTAEGRLTGSSDENSQKYKTPSESSENSPKESTTDLYQTGGSGSKTPQSESTDQGIVSGVHGSDVTGTTKNPDDFSNNIKDENEDFNALIEQETVPGEGKEILLSKFSNKFSKPDKKKLKDFDKKFGDGTTKSGITPEEYSLQKHTKGNENGFDLDYSFPKEHTTVPDVISHGVPGVSFNEHGINNHDISILQTVTPDLKTETVVSGDIRSKSPDSKEVDKDYSKFDKDYKYKEKGGKKKDLKKKIGGKDGKNVELDDSRKYFTDSMEEGKDFSDSTQTPTFERVGPIVFNNKDYEGLLPREESEEVTTGGSGSHLPGQGFGGTTIIQTDGGRGEGLQQGGEYYIRGGQVTNGGAVVTNATSPGTVYDGQFHTFTTFRNPNQSSQNQTVTYVPGTIFDGVSHRTIPSTTFTQRFENGNGGQFNTTYVVYETTLPNGTVVITNTSSTAHPTIIVRGQSGSLQDGHTIKSFDFGNGSFGFPENYQFKFSNGSTVHPTIVIRGQSGALQDGHESRFVNGSFGGANGNYFGGGRVVTNSTVYRIENGSLPGTVFDGHFNPQEGHYHMFTNASGTFVYTNATSQPTFVIKGSSGDFGNSKGYILGNQTRTVLNHTFPSTWFSNGTGFAQGIHEVLTRPQNETIKYTHQITPTTFSSSYDSSVNNYFGYISKCAAGQFQCLNGTSKRGSACISLSSKCDSINDCSDGSDELGCIESGCPGNFQCSDGSCLKRHLVCNGIVDCSDGSDEQKCESWKCEFDEFQCPSGRCIPVVWQCDNKPDCDNHTDEYNCQTSCGNDEYLCPEGWCIPLTYKCNGVKECSNGEDEQLCDCSLDEFKCHTGGCVSKTSVCNGLDDCPDRSDEWGCVQLEPETNLIKIRTAAGGYEPICADGWTTQHSDEVCASLGYSSSIPLEVDNSASSITNEKSFFILKSNRTEHFSKKLLVNLMRSNDTCSSGKLVEITCQEFSCGSRSMTDSSVEARLVGGKTATAGQWPSVALLYNVRNLHSCTANVLTPRWVLASYNCLKMGNKNLNQQDWKMFGGSTVFETEKETAETRNIVSIVPHPQVKFNQFLFSNDLALVELDEPLYFTSSMGAVCLPEQEIQPRQICVTAGWGMNAPEDKVIRQQLQYLPVPTMNLTECNSTEHYSGFITEDKICAGYNAAEKSLCYNEEGAPLMCVNDRGEWELQGVLSYHSNCGRGSHPSIFSSITPAKEWIKQTIGNSFERKVIPVTKR